MNKSRGVSFGPALLASIVLGAGAAPKRADDIKMDIKARTFEIVNYCGDFQRDLQIKSAIFSFQEAVKNIKKEYVIDFYAPIPEQVALFQELVLSDVRLLMADCVSDIVLESNDSSKSEKMYITFKGEEERVFVGEMVWDYAESSGRKVLEGRFKSVNVGEKAYSVNVIFDFVVENSCEEGDTECFS